MDWKSSCTTHDIAVKAAHLYMVYLHWGVTVPTAVRWASMAVAVGEGKAP